jgi:hypothetical protein
MNVPKESPDPKRISWPARWCITLAADTAQTHGVLIRKRPIACGSEFAGKMCYGLARECGQHSMAHYEHRAEA